MLELLLLKPNKPSFGACRAGGVWNRLRCVKVRRAVLVTLAVAGPWADPAKLRPLHSIGAFIADRDTTPDAIVLT